MRRRILVVGLCAGIAGAIALGISVPACYDPPRPACGFVCGPDGACPPDYTCGGDRRCRLNGSPGSMVCVADGGVADTFGGSDGGMIDAGRAIDAAIDARPDAAADARPDAPTDASPDAPTDAPTD